MIVTKPKVVPNNKMKIVKQKTKKKMTMAQDAVYDRKHGIKAGSKEDKAMDQKNGVMYKGKKSKTKNKNWIAGAIKKPGALHTELGVKQGSKIPAVTLASAAKKGGKEGQRAQLAETLKGFHKDKSKAAGQKAYLKRVGTKGMGAAC